MSLIRSCPEFGQLVAEQRVVLHDALDDVAPGAFVELGNAVVVVLEPV